MRHEFLTLTEPYYDGISHKGGEWYCACGRWQYKCGPYGDRSVRLRSGKLEFTRHLNSLKEAE